VFLGSASALVLAAGIGFIALGVWTLLSE